jgi:hypothetical protein
MSRLHLKVSLSFVTITVALSLAPAARASYYFTEINPPGSISTEALGLNDSGVVAGSYNDATGFGLGFVDNNGVYTTLAPTTEATGCGFYATICNQAWGVNNSGDVVGTYFTTTGSGPNDGTPHGFLYTNGNYSTFTPLNVPGAGATEAYGISNNGLVVGEAQESSGNVGFIYTISTGQYSTFTLPNLPTGATYVPFAINNAGVVVGSYSPPPTITPAPGGGETITFGATYTFLYTLGSSGYTLLPQDPAAIVGPLEGTLGSGINDEGDVAGNYTVDGNVGFGFLPFVYIDGTYVNFTVYLPSDPFVDNSGANGINNLGDIVGYYSSSPYGEFAGFLAIPAPEPSTWARCCSVWPV